MQMDNAEREMALDSYGFGHWKAPYWFIGPEQGKSRGESDENRDRENAWRKLGAKDLCDCRSFHTAIRDDTRHGEKAQLQPTWRRLILLLMAYLGKNTEKNSLRDYQRDCWGMSNGETCVIELSGLAAKSLQVPQDRNRFRTERVEYIQQKMQAYKPELVVMYGIGAQGDFLKLAGCTLQRDGALRHESTIFALAQHPVARGKKDEYWINLGHECSGLRNGS